MYSYHAYTLTIHSDLLLPGLPRGVGAPDVTISRRPIDKSELSSDGQFFGKIFDDLHFLLVGGERVVLDVRKPLAEDVLRALVLGPIMGALLRQRGLLVLHACCVTRDGEAIAFLGESGWGKSTLAEFLCQRGFDLLTDDVLAVELDATTGPPRALPGYPHIRLLPETGSALLSDFEELPLFFEGGAKRLRVCSEMQRTPVPLKKLYMLNSAYAPAHSIEPLSASEVVLRLIRHTRVMHAMTAPPVLTRHLQQCSQLVGAVPASELHRKASLEALPALLDLVERDLESLDSSPGPADAPGPVDASPGSIPA